MAVTAKFRVSEVKEPYPGSSRTVVLTPDYGTAEEPKNAEWSIATPSGRIEMAITNPEAFEQFALGREFTVIFE